MKNNKGFTLVEILIALALMGLVTTAIYQLYISQYKTWVSQDIVTEMQQSGRFAIDTMTREMQLAGYNLDPDLPATEKAVMEATSTRFTFISTDTTITDTNKRTRKISFYYDSANQRLKMDVTTWDNTGAGSYGSTETNTLADNVTALLYSYYDDQGNTTAVVDDIRRIKASIVVRTNRKDPVTGNYKSMTLVTEIRPRNLGIGESFTDLTPPATPTGVQIIDPGNCGTLKLKWNANTEIDIAGYTIYYSTTSNTSYTTVKVPVSAYGGYSLTGLTTTVSNAAGPTTYYIRVDAYDSFGNSSAWTAEYSGNPSPNVRAFGAGGNDTTVNISKAPAPTNFIGTSGGANNTVALTWEYDSNVNAQVTGFRIYRSTGQFTTYPIVPNGTTIKLIAGAPGDTSSNILGPTARSFTDNDPNDILLGCVKYYYAIAAVPCDTTLVSNDVGDNDTKRYIQSNYAATCGDGAAACSAGTGFAAVANSDTTPTDTTLPPPPIIQPSAGWKAVFLNIENPVLSGPDPAKVAADFSHSLVYFNEGGTCPTVDTTSGSPTYGNISNGFALPNSDSGVRGRFTTTGVIPPVTHLDDDCIFNDCSDRVLNGTVRNLENASTYCYLGVSYDRCGNPRPIANTVTTLTELCGDDPSGAPGNGTKSGEFWPTVATPISVQGCQASGGLNINWNSMNHTYPAGYFDGAFYRVHMKTGDSDFSSINPNDAVTLKTSQQAELAVTTSFSTGPIVSGVSDGERYYFGITATDCVFENNYASFPLNYSGWLTKGPITPGELKREEKINATRDLHKEILTGVTIDNSDGNGNGSTSPSSSFRHNTVMMFLENTSAGNMTIQKATVQWVNSLAYLREVRIGGGLSGKSRQTTSIAQAASISLADSPYTRKVTDYAITNGTIAGLARHVPISFTFRDLSDNPYIDMRGDQLRITLSVKNESTGTITCVSYLTTSSPQTVGDILIPTGPSLMNTQQYPPSSGGGRTSGYAVPGSLDTANTVPSGSYGPVAINAGNWVSVYTDYQSNTASAVTGNKIPISSVKLYYKATDKSVTSAPTSGYTEVNMWWWNITAGTASSSIPALDGKRVWYYTLAVDEDGNYSRDPEIQYGAYVYDQKDPDPCDVTPFMDQSWGILDTWAWSPSKSFADAASNTVTLNWWTLACYEPDCSTSQYGSDTFFYKVYRRDSSSGSYAPVSAGNCSGNVVCPQGWWQSCSCMDDASSGLDVTNNDNSYYIKVVNSCDPANNLNLSSGSSNVFSECAGLGGGPVLSVDKTSMLTWDMFTITINKCDDAADGGWDDIINNLNISTASGRDVDIVSAYEDDAGTYHLQIWAYPSTTDCDTWDWYGWAWGGGYICVSNSDIITVSLAGAAGSPQTIAVSADPCNNSPAAPTGLNLEIADANEANRSNSTSIHVKFTAPQTNTDASDLVDLDHYVLLPTKSGSAMSTVTIPLSACTSSLSNPAAGTTCDYTYNGGARMRDFEWSFSVKAVDSCSVSSVVLGPKGETCTASSSCPRYYP